MPIPTYDKFIEPMLRYLAQHSEGAPASVVYEAVGSALGINENDRLTLLPAARSRFIRIVLAGPMID